MSSKRIIGMLLAASLLGVMFAGCAQLGAVAPTEAPTEAPVNPVETPTEASNDAPIPVDGPLAVIYRHGGLCVTGAECESTMTIQNDGTYEVTVNGETRTGSLTTEQVAHITQLIGETDFDTMLNTPFTGECPVAADGQEVVYTFYHTGGAMELASCKVTLDTDAPLFVLLDQIFAEATAAN